MDQEQVHLPPLKEGLGKGTARFAYPLADEEHRDAWRIAEKPNTFRQTEEELSIIPNPNLLFPPNGTPVFLELRPVPEAELRVLVDTLRGPKAVHRLTVHGNCKNRSRSQPEQRGHQKSHQPDSHSLTPASAQKRIPGREIHLRPYPHDASPATTAGGRSGRTFGVVPNPMALVIVLAAGSVANPYDDVGLTTVATGFATARNVGANAPGIRTMPGTAHRVVGQSIGKRAKRADQNKKQTKPLPSPVIFQHPLLERLHCKRSGAHHQEE